jgi:hypothetical protein
MKCSETLRAQTAFGRIAIILPLHAGTVSGYRPHAIERHCVVLWPKLCLVRPKLRARFFEDARLAPTGGRFQKQLGNMRPRRWQPGLPPSPVHFVFPPPLSPPPSAPRRPRPRPGSRSALPLYPSPTPTPPPTPPTPPPPPPPAPPPPPPSPPSPPYPLYHCAHILSPSPYFHISSPSSSPSLPSSSVVPPPNSLARFTLAAKIR